jgi:hypothetical protein
MSIRSVAGTALLAAVVAASAAAQAARPAEAPASPLLASYDFERPTPSGPDTFWARAAEGAAVDLSTAFRFEGERSLRLHERAGNGDFVEFLAYFPERLTGSVFVQFYVLFAEPGERFNFGLAGSRWFLSRGRHGHAVWLQTEGGRLRHQPASGWEDLLAIRPFVWYLVDLAYHVDSGRYDLAIWEEDRRDPLVDLRGVRGFADADASSVRFASLIGDLEDRGSFDVFVDQLVIGSHPSVRLAPFVAPGRRRLFIDVLAAGTPPPAGAERDLPGLARSYLPELLDESRPLDGELAAAVEGVADAALRAGDLPVAAELLEGLRRSPDGAQVTRAMLKLSDVYHLSGNRRAERALREAIYGRLTYEEASRP